MPVTVELQRRFVPALRSRKNTRVKPGELVSLATRLLAALANATNCPLLLMARVLRAEKAFGAAVSDAAAWAETSSLVPALRSLRMTS